jgi:hypothetical protein
MAHSYGIYNNITMKRPPLRPVPKPRPNPNLVGDYQRLDVLAVTMIGAIVIIGIMAAMAIASVTQPWPGCVAHPNTILGAIINGCV